MRKRRSRSKFVESHVEERCETRMKPQMLRIAYPILLMLKVKLGGFCKGRTTAQGTTCCGEAAAAGS